MKLILLTLLISIFSCNNIKQHTVRKNNSKINSSIREINPSQIIILDFTEYWEVFGKAIQTNDTNKIKLLVEDPLIVLGREDQDPQLNIKGNQIIKYILFSINNGGYYVVEKDTSISNKTLLMSNLNNISEYKDNSDIQWINDFVFKKTSHGWKLITLYMDTKNVMEQ